MKIEVMRESYYGGKVERLVVSDILAWRPGSYDTNLAGNPWDWSDETYDILTRECVCCGEEGHYQRQLEAKMESEGEFWPYDDPIVLGDDGRVWEGHHRILGSVRLGWTDLSIEHGLTSHPGKGRRGHES